MTILYTKEDTTTVQSCGDTVTYLRDAQQTDYLYVLVIWTVNQ